MPPISNSFLYFVHILPRYFPSLIPVFHNCTLNNWVPVSIIHRLQVYIPLFGKLLKRLLCLLFPCSLYLRDSVSNKTSLASIYVFHVVMALHIGCLFLILSSDPNALRESDIITNLFPSNSAFLTAILMACTSDENTDASLSNDADISPPKSIHILETVSTPKYVPTNSDTSTSY